MDMMTLINSRRSIRSFKKKTIPQALVKKIVECGLAAPSSKNSNPWFFVIIRGKQKNQIASWIEEAARKRDAATAPTNATSGKMATGAFDSTAESVQTIREASVLIAVFNRGPLSGGYEAVMKDLRGGRSLYTYAGEIIGIGAAVQNILLAAHAQGLGAVYMADSYPGRIAVQKSLKTSCEMIGSIAIGYPAYSLPERKKEKKLIKTWNQAIGDIPTENFTANKF